MLTSPKRRSLRSKSGKKETFKKKEKLKYLIVDYGKGVTATGSTLHNFVIHIYQMRLALFN